MTKKEAARMAELEKVAAMTARVLETNGKQLTRLVGAELLRGRLAELEGMLDDAIDERDKAKAERDGALEQLKQYAQARGLR